MYISIKPLLLILSFFSFLLIACTDSNETKQAENPQEVTELTSTTDVKSEEIVNRALQKAGGLDLWNQKKSLSYYKISQYFDSTGNPTRKVTQFHQYQLKPRLKFRISWEEDGDKFVIVNTGDKAWKTINGKVSEEESDINHAWNSSFGSHYVIGMPFKLRDPGVNLSYEGEKTLRNGRIAHNVKVTYSPGAGSAAGMHSWNYYFDPERGGLLANKIDYQNGSSYTAYESFEEVGGIMLSKERKSYQVDEDGNMGRLTTQYTNEELSFDVELKDSLFE